jgi:aminoglycoside phosphotransferase (APT) family kinase protein
MTAESDRAKADRYRAGLEPFLAGLIPNATNVEVSGVTPISSVGNARRPWRFDVEWRAGGDRERLRCVMLVKVPEGQLETELASEFAALQVLHPRGVPVPRPLWLDSVGDAFGEAFFATEWLPGVADLELMRRPPGDPQARAVALGVADAAACLHTVDWEGAGVGFLPRVTAEGAAVAQLDEWEEKFARQRLEPLPALAYAFDWLRDRAPRAARVSMVHGDFRFGNVLYDHDRVTAVLDWELVHLGDPLEDLAWSYRTKWNMAQLLPLDDFLDRYTAASGLAVDAECFRWYRMFVEVKHTVISLTAARSFADGRTTWLRHADRASMTTPFLRRCYDLMQSAVGAELTP